MIEFYQLEQLVAIAEAGTLSKAAETLLISQPALTRSIQRLEEDLNLSLFDRKKNKITLNDNGKLAVELMSNLLKERDLMIESLHAYERSKSIISIGSCAPAPIWLLKYALNKINADIKINDTINSNEEVLLAGLKNYEYSVIVLTHPIEDDEYECIELFEEALYLSLPPAHPLALFKEVSFDDLNGESVLLLSRIGFWNEICVKMIPQSHLLIQEDNAVFNELTKASALPCFSSNITIQRDHDEENRIKIPFVDKEAHVTYFAIYHKDKHHLFESIEAEINTINWKDTINY